MPEQLAQPGVYIEEIPSGVHTITGVATSVTAFVGRTARGSVDRPVTITGFDGFVREFGGLWSGSLLGFAVRDFFLNGGGQAVIGRLYREPATPSKGYAALAFGTGDQQVSLRAASPGPGATPCAPGWRSPGRPPVSSSPSWSWTGAPTGPSGTPGSPLRRPPPLRPHRARTRVRPGALGGPPLTPPAPGGARVRPLPGPDPTAWQDAAGRAEAGAAEAEGPLKAAVADLAKASAARSAAEAEAARAKAEHTVAESAKRSATDAGTAAEAERARAEDGVKSAGKEVDDAKKLDQNVPANRQKLADAQAKLAQAQTAAAGAGQAADRAAAALAQRTTEAAAAADRETATAKAADDARAAAANAATAEQGRGPTSPPPRPPPPMPPTSWAARTART
ncbi:hypothetical protein ACFQ0M_09230 [Kitasatospora aburaviensis]